MRIPAFSHAHQHRPGVVVTQEAPSASARRRSTTGRYAFARRRTTTRRSASARRRSTTRRSASARRWSTTRRPASARWWSTSPPRRAGIGRFWGYSTTFRPVPLEAISDAALDARCSQDPLARLASAPLTNRGAVGPRRRSAGRSRRHVQHISYALPIANMPGATARAPGRASLQPRGATVRRAGDAIAREVLPRRRSESPSNLP